MSSDSKVKTALVYVCTFAGACLGTFGFFGIAFLTWPNPLSNALRTSIATIGRDNDHVVRIADVQKISELIQSGYLVTTNELLSSVANYYGTLVSVLLGLIALLAAGAYLTIRGNSMSHVEGIISDKVREGSNHFFESIRFNELVTNSVGKIKKLDSENAQNEMEAIRASIEELTNWRSSIDISLGESTAASPEEPDDVIPQKIKQPGSRPRQSRTQKPSQDNGN